MVFLAIRYIKAVLLIKIGYDLIGIVCYSFLDVRKKLEVKICCREFF